MPTIEKTADLRIPVSFRLPTSLVRKVEAYAEQNRLSKTTAFEHFLQLGIESELNKEGEAEFSLAKARGLPPPMRRSALKKPSVLLRKSAPQLRRFTCSARLRAERSMRKAR